MLSWHQVSFIGFQIARVMHYHNVRNTDPLYKNKLRDTIYLNRNEAKTIVWIEEDEIRYKGKMFDVKRQLERGDELLLVGHYDSKDDMLLAATFSFFDDTPEPGEHKKDSVRILLFDAVLYNTAQQLRYHLSFHDKHTYPFVNSFYKPELLEKSSPPPEQLRA